VSAKTECRRDYHSCEDTAGTPPRVVLVSGSSGAHDLPPYVYRAVSNQHRIPTGLGRVHSYRSELEKLKKEKNCILSLSIFGLNAKTEDDDEINCHAGIILHVHPAIRMMGRQNIIN
jgi:hypothetical protein